MVGSSRSRSRNWMRGIRKTSRADTGRFERLHDGQHRLDFGERRTEPFDDRLDIAGEVAGLVDHVDHVLADDAAHGIGDRQYQLLAPDGRAASRRRRQSLRDCIRCPPRRAEERPHSANEVGAASPAGAPPTCGPSSGKTFSSSVPSPCSSPARLTSGASPSQSPAGHRRPRQSAAWRHRRFVRPDRRPRRPCRGAGCARSRSRHRRQGRDWRAAAA